MFWIRLGRFFITNIGVYIVKQFSNSKVLYGTDGKICKMYTFKTSLNYSLIKYLKDIFNERADDADVICFLDAVGIITLHKNHATFRMNDALQKFEQIIRLIPGSFQNGDWVALGGFFGMYFNKKTLEISEGPPPFNVF